MLLSVCPGRFEHLTDTRATGRFDAVVGGTRGVQRPAQTEPAWLPKVVAYIHSDDYEHQGSFDATAALGALTDDDLRELVEDGFRHGYAADGVAYANADHPAVAAVLAYCRDCDESGMRNPPGFEVELDASAALVWLMHARPNLYLELNS